jgi:hypothetical protein
MSAALAPSVDQLSRFEWAFIRTVLEHRGVFREANDGDLDAAVAVLKSYDAQCADNPGGGAWQPILDEEQLTELKAKAFVMFGATKPTPAQWHKAHAALFGPLLCEACG